MGRGPWEQGRGSSDLDQGLREDFIEEELLSNLRWKGEFEFVR